MRVVGILFAVWVIALAAVLLLAVTFGLETAARSVRTEVEQPIAP